ncbi:transcription termination factor NusA, partial [Patescibacteria group bacterium]|nr:transcription termination factor NusA [Patescibacteria group bacterium]
EIYDGATAGIRIFDVKEVVADMELPDDYFERFEAAHAQRRQMQPVKPAAPVETAEKAPAPETGETQKEGEEKIEEEDEFMFNPKTMIMLSDARDLKPDAQIGEEIKVELSIPAAFGRMAAQTAKQVIMQKLREAERGVIYEDFKGREGELMNVTVQRREGRIVLIDLGRATGVLLPEDQIENERYYPGTRIKALLREVTMTTKGPEIRLSRSSPGVVASLFAQEIPEILNGVVEIKNIAREAGSRTKVAVTTNDDAIDPIGSCIGQRGTRIQTIIRELGGEKIDVVLCSEDMAEYIANALSPAKVLNVELRPADHLAIVKVEPDQLSLAIGKGGQNVRLAARLTGWKITVAEKSGEIVADSEVGEFEKPEEAGEKAEETVSEIAPEKTDADETAVEITAEKPETADEADAVEVAAEDAPEIAAAVETEKE